MKMPLITYLLGCFALLWLGPGMLSAQNGGISYAFDGNLVVATLHPNQIEQPLDSLLCSLGTNEKEVEEWQNNLHLGTTESGWKLMKASRKNLIFSKPIKEIKTDQNFLKHGLDPLNPGSSNLVRMDQDFGVNQFKNPTVTASEGKVKFLLPAFFNAKQVFLAGTFNDWSLSSTSMKRTAKGWQVELELEPGKHLYKFVVDGKWKLDKENEIQEDDGHGNINSVYYQPNHIFVLPGFPDAKRVYVAGSFNDWEEKELQMTRSDHGWEFPLFMRQGSHTYRFIVDGVWVTDPANPDFRLNEFGDKNSLLTLGTPTQFQLNTFPRAKSVYLIGDFNDWNEETLPLKQARGEGAWKISQVLKPGNYEYKFLAGGSLIPDPENPHTIGHDNKRNSVIAVQPNYTFRLKGYAGAKEVLISGDFNDWSEEGYTLFNDGREWHISLHLPPGKTHYKFIVDGAWMADPQNPLWEENEFATKNSILWVR